MPSSQTKSDHETSASSTRRAAVSAPQARSPSTWHRRSDAPGSEVVARTPAEELLQRLRHARQPRTVQLRHEFRPGCGGDRTQRLAVDHQIQEVRLGATRDVAVDESACHHGGHQAQLRHLRAHCGSITVSPRLDVLPVPRIGGGSAGGGGGGVLRLLRRQRAAPGSGARTCSPPHRRGTRTKAVPGAFGVRYEPAPAEPRVNDVRAPTTRAP